ncbi:YopX family protein [Fibrobacter sp.]|uniref:YopX family protein n=1 Tax=Fibrobacter sp. TaxID=35828 RepID=UPI00388E50A6
MRETLFRGRISENSPYEGLRGTWIEGGLFIGDHFYNMRVDPETVSEFIGKRDKYGQKIFEGDIVKTKYGRLCIVEWFNSQTYMGWDLKVVNTRENVRNTSAPDAYDMWASKNLEVVGNIHDNPEMLKG